MPRKASSKPKTTLKKPEEKFDITKIKIDLKPKNLTQKNLIQSIKTKEITLCTGPAGCGKTHLACAEALRLLKLNLGYKKIILVKPIVEAGEESLGYLKGSLEEKISNYQDSYLYIFNKLIGVEATQSLFNEKLIEIKPISFMRGINYSDLILVFDEAQNASPSAMKTLLTRIGENTKYIILGDLEQSDKYKDKTKTGLYDIINRLKDMEEIDIVNFGIEDIVRNDLIKKILRRYVD